MHSNNCLPVTDFKGELTAKKDQSLSGWDIWFFVPFWLEPQPDIKKWPDIQPTGTGYRNGNTMKVLYIVADFIVLLSLCYTHFIARSLVFDYHDVAFFIHTRVVESFWWHRSAETKWTNHIHNKLNLRILYVASKREACVVSCLNGIYYELLIIVIIVDDGFLF